MAEILVLGIERMVDLERASALGNRAGNVDVAGEITRVATWGSAVTPNTP